MNKLAQLVEQVGIQELVLIQKDLETGTLQRIVEARLRQQRSGKTKTCPVCGANLQQHEAIRLEFGPSDLRQQAHFDATDCLQHFIEHTLKNKSRQQKT